MTYYLIHIEFGDPTLYGPFETEHAQHAKAQELYKEHGGEMGTGDFVWLDINADGIPAVGTYTQNDLGAEE
jgi:hypothetical protein